MTVWTDRTSSTSYWGSTRDIYDEDILLAWGDTTGDLLYWGDGDDPILVISATIINWGDRTQPNTTWGSRTAPSEGVWGSRTAPTTTRTDRPSI